MLIPLGLFPNLLQHYILDTILLEEIHQSIATQDQ